VKVHAAIHNSPTFTFAASHHEAVAAFFATAFAPAFFAAVLRWAAHRLRVASPILFLAAALILRFFGAALAALLACSLEAAHRFRCATAILLRAAALMVRFFAAGCTSAANACPPNLARISAIAALIFAFAVSYPTNAIASKLSSVPACFAMCYSCQLVWLRPDCITGARRIPESHAGSWIFSLARGKRLQTGYHRSVTCLCILVLFQYRSPQAGFHRARFRFPVLFQDRIANGDALVADEDAAGTLRRICDEGVYLIVAFAAEWTSGDFLLGAGLAEHDPSMARAQRKSRSANFPLALLIELKLCLVRGICG
jgi:hypothetical protein